MLEFALFSGLPAALRNYTYTLYINWHNLDDRVTLDMTLVMLM